MRIYFLFILVLLLSVPVFSQNNASQSFYSGRTLEAQGRMDEAMFHYNEAVRISLDEINRNVATDNSYVILTWTLQRQQRFNEVITWGERGLARNPNNHRLIEIMGEAYFYLDDYDRSLNLMQRYVSVSPQGDRVSTAYFFIGEIFRLRRQFRHADIAYTTALQIDPGMPLWWYRLGLVRESLRDFSFAIEAYERALRINPTYQEALQGLERVRRAI